MTHPDARIVRLRCRRTTRPLRTEFRTSLGSKTRAVSVLIKITLDGGQAGLGEAPTSFVYPHETPEAIRDVLWQARPALVGSPIGEYPNRLAELRQRLGRFRMALAGLEVALFRASLTASGGDEWRWWAGRSREIETDITVTFLSNRSELAPWVRGAVRKGFRRFKVKVTGDVRADLAFVGAVRDELLAAGAEGFVLRLDGNQGYTVDSCLRMLDGLSRAGIEIELFEQPLAAGDFAGLRKLTAASPAPVILDETVFDVDSCRRAVDEKLGHGVNVKIAKSGIAGSAEMIRLCRAAGLRLMVGCMTETMVGLSAGIRMAAGTAAFDYVDLDAAHLLFNQRRHGEIEIAGPRYVLHVPSKGRP